MTSNGLLWFLDFSNFDHLFFFTHAWRKSIRPWQLISAMGKTLRLKRFHSDPETSVGMITNAAPRVNKRFFFVRREATSTTNPFQLICIDSVMTQHWLSVVSAPNSNIYCMLRRNWRNIYNSVVYQLRLPNDSAVNQLRLSCSAFQPITQLTFRALFRFTWGKFLMVYAW